MKLIETLTTTQLVDLLNGNKVSFFNHLFNQNDSFYSKTNAICLGYYTERSGEKTISPTYEKLIKLVEENETVTQTTEELLGSLIRSKFIDKWERVYQVLINEQYSALDNSYFTETKSKTDNNTKTYGMNIAKNGSNIDTKTYNTTVEDTGENSNKQTTIRENNENNDFYGFNSITPVPESSSNNSESETTQGSALDNTNHNINTKTGTDTIDYNINESETRSGTDTDNTTITENSSNSGRNVSGAELITEELNLRNEQIFFNIIYKDIDSITTIQIYI